MTVTDILPPARRSLRPARTAATVLQALCDRTAEIEARAPLLDQTRAFPEADVAMLHEIGALEVFATGEVEALELMEALRLVGRANLSLGRIFEGHVNGARLVDWYGDEAQRRALGDDLKAGKLFGVWNTQPEPGVTITGSEDQRRLSGSKSYATGAGFVDRAIVTAEVDGGRQMVIADGADPQRANLSAWNVSGMRATCSGLYDLTGLPVNEATKLGGPGDYVREPQFSAGAWRFTAVQLGGVERVLMLLRDCLADRDKNLTAIPAARFGGVLAAVRSAYLWVREAAERAESPTCGPDEIAFVLMTRGVVENAGLEVMQAATRTVGTKAFFEDHPLDQACRDLALYLRQPAPDQALERAARAFIEKDCWAGDRLW